VGRPPPAPPGGATTATLARRRGDYGFDAPYVLLGLGAAGGLFLAAAGALARWRPTRWALVPAGYGAMLLVSLASYLYTTRRGKLAVWADLLRGLGLRGNEAGRVLRPGGRLLIADFRGTAGEYAPRLRERGLPDVAQRRLDRRFWYGGPWAATSLVTATAPARVPGAP
jgi:hypothetical protein